MVLPVYSTTYLHSLAGDMFAPAKPFSPGNSLRLLSGIKQDARNDRSLFLCIKSYRESRLVKATQARNKRYWRIQYYTKYRMYCVGTVSWETGAIVLVAEFPSRSAAAKHITTLL